MIKPVVDVGNDLGVKSVCSHNHFVSSKVAPENSLYT